MKVSLRGCEIEAGVVEEAGAPAGVELLISEHRGAGARVARCELRLAPEEARLVAHVLLHAADQARRAPERN